MKSKTLTVFQQTAIAQFAVDNPGMSDREIALSMRCTIPQVRYARAKAATGEITVRRTHVSDEVRAAGETHRATDDELLAEQLHKALGALSADVKMKPGPRVALLASLTRTKAKLFEMNLASHMKATDAGVIYTLIRMFRPDASESDCIKLYLEATETWRASQH